MAMKYSRNAYKNRAQNRDSSGTDSSFEISEELQKQLDEKAQADHDIRQATGREFVDYNDRSQDEDGQNFKANKKFLDSVYKNTYANATRDPDTGEAEAFKGRGVKAKTAAAMEQRDDAVTQLKIDHPEYFAGKRPENSFSVEGFANHKDQLKILGLDKGDVDKELAAKMLGVVKVVQEAAWDASDMNALYTSKKNGNWRNLNSQTTPVPKRSTIFPDEAVKEFKKNLSRQGDEDLLDDLNDLRKEAGMKSLSMANFAVAAHRGRYADVKENASIANNHLGNKQRDYTRGWQELETKATEHNVELDHDVRAPSYAEGKSQKELVNAIQVRSTNIDEGLSSLVEKDEGRKKVLNYISKYAKGITELEPDDIKNRDKLVEAVKGFAKQNGDGKWVAGKNRDEAADTIISIAKNINERNALTIEHVAKDPDIRNREEGNGVFTDNAAKAQRDLIRDLGMTKSSADERRNVLTAINQFASAGKDFKDPNNLIGQLVEKNGGDASLSRQNVSDAIESWNFQKSSNNFAIIKRYQSVLPEGKEYNPEENKRDFKKTKYPNREYDVDDHASDVTDDEDRPSRRRNTRRNRDYDEDDSGSENQELRRQVRTLTRQVSRLQETLETSQITKSDDPMDVDEPASQRSTSSRDDKIFAMIEKIDDRMDQFEKSQKTQRQAPATEKEDDPVLKRITALSDKMDKMGQRIEGIENGESKSNDLRSEQAQNAQTKDTEDPSDLTKALDRLSQQMDGFEKRLSVMETSKQKDSANNEKQLTLEDVTEAVKKVVDPVSKKVTDMGNGMQQLEKTIGQANSEVSTLRNDTETAFNHLGAEIQSQRVAIDNVDAKAQAAGDIGQQAGAAVGTLRSETGNAFGQLASENQDNRRTIQYVGAVAHNASTIGTAALQSTNQLANNGGVRKLGEGTQDVSVHEVSETMSATAIGGSSQPLALTNSPMADDTTPIADNRRDEIKEKVTEREAR